MKKTLFNEQSSLISRINKELSQEVYSNFVPNYKSLATLHQIFNNPKVEAKSRVLLEETVIEEMTAIVEKEENKMDHIDDVVYKTFTKNFNDTYETLNERQKTLLKTYIGSVGDDLEMKIFLDEELETLRAEISESVELEVFPEKKEEILGLLETFGQKDIDQQDLTKIMKIQQLVEETKR